MIQPTSARLIPPERKVTQFGRTTQDTYLSAKEARSLNKKIHGTIVNYMHGYVVYERATAKFQ